MRARLRTFAWHGNHRRPSAAPLEVRSYHARDAGLLPHMVTVQVRERASRRTLSRARFWLRRYLPAEVASLVGLLVAARVGAAAELPRWTTAVLATALSGIGFYGVLAAQGRAEQVRAGCANPSRRAGLLLLAEFGPSELLDALLVRPTAIWLALALIPTAGVAVVAGKIAADLVFYAVAAAAFAVTVRAGLRRAERHDEPSRS